MVRSGGASTPAGRATDDAAPVRARVRFLEGGPVDPGVRTPISDSWQRCRSLGLSPDGSDLPFREGLDPEARIVGAAVPVLDRLEYMFAGTPMNLCVADAQGTVLLRRFGEASLARRLPAIQRVPGFVFAEQYAGTNGIGLALAERRLVHVHGAEHFAERAQGSACRALPVRDLLSGRIEGVLCFGYPRSFEDPALATVIRKAARAIERRLLGRSSARERALLRAYLDTEAEAAVGGHHTVGLDELALAQHPRDRAILMEKATELISFAQRAAVHVPLSDGRRVTLMSRPMTSATGVEGLAIEAVLPGPAPRHPLVAPRRIDALPDFPAEAAVSHATAPAGTAAVAAPGRAARVSPPSERRTAVPAPRPRRGGCCSSGSRRWRGTPSPHDAAWSCCPRPVRASAPPWTCAARPRNWPRRRCRSSPTTSRSTCPRPYCAARRPRTRTATCAARWSTASATTAPSIRSASRSTTARPRPSCAA